MILRQSTSQTVRVGPFVDSTDGVTAEAGLTIANTDVKLSKDGAAFANKNSGGATADGSNGWYSMTLDATDTATVGILELEITVSGALPVFKTFYVVEEAVYDALYAASAAGPLQSTTAGRTLDVTATGAAGINWGNVENASTAVDLSGTDIQLCDTVTTNTDMRGTDSASLATALATAQTDLDTITGSDGVTLATTQGNYAPSTHSALDVWHVAASSVVTASTIGLQLKTNVDAVLSDIEADTQDLQTQVGTAGDGLSAIPTQDANLIQIEGHALAGTGTRIADGFEYFFNVATPAKTLNDCGVAGSGLTAQDVWEYNISAISTTGLAGSELNDASSGGSAPSAAAIRAEIDSNSTQLAAIVADTNEMQGDLANGGRLDLIFDAILEDTGTTIPALFPSNFSFLAIAGTGHVGIDWSNVANESSTVDLSGTTIDNLNSTASVDAVTLDGNTPSTLIQSSSAAALTAYDPPTKAELDAGFAALNDLSSAEVNAACDTAVTDVLVSAHTEPTGVPAANETIVDKIGYVFMALRNEVRVTSSKKTFYDDSGSAEWEKDLSDDGTTYTESEGNAI